MIEETIVGKELYQLTEGEATEILLQFLANEKEVFKQLKVGSVDLDYSRKSVVLFFKHILSNIFDTGNVESEVNNIWISRVAYYFGESLKKSSNRLDWGIGEQETAFENHPTLKGFDNGIEAALITISRNILYAVMVDGEPESTIEDAVNWWFDAGRS